MDNILQKVEFFNYVNLIFFISILILSISLCFSKTNFILVITNGLISAIICLSYLLLDAPDVALTEASIGACVSTIIFVLIIKYIKNTNESAIKPKKYLISFVISALFAYVIYNLSKDFPEIGNKNNPVHSGVVSYYLQNTQREIGIPAYVAAILASYRGFDTLGETFVILVAAISVLSIMGIFNAKRKHNS